MKVDLNTWRGYDIAAAIRGPDCECYWIKLLFTGEVRRLAAPWSIPPLEPPDGAIERATDELQFSHSYDHYLRHIQAAAEALNHRGLVQIARDVRFNGRFGPSDEVVRIIGNVNYEKRIEELTQ